MKIHLHLLCYNEADMIEKTLDAYSWVDAVTVWDSYSEDNSREIAISRGCTVINFGIQGLLDDTAFIKVKNNVAKHSPNADWIIMADMDEILFSPTGTRKAIEDADKAGATIIRTEGYNMIDDSMPEQLTDCRFGCRASQYDKILAFKKTATVAYSMGAHQATIQNRIDHEQSLFLLHYKFIGGIERIFAKYQQNARRLSPLNKRYKWSSHYMQTLEQVQEGINNGRKQLIEVWKI
jgi:glycosyltransferase involved in cell wall biosynthesis